MPGTEPTLNCPRYSAGQRPKLAGYCSRAAPTGSEVRSRALQLGSREWALQGRGDKIR